MKYLPTLALCAVIAACGGSDFENQIKAQLKDPESAQFRNKAVSEEFGSACIEWNAKNSFGGYGGWKRADFEKLNGEWILDSTDGSSQCDEEHLKFASEHRAREARGVAAAASARAEAVELWARGRNISEPNLEERMNAIPDCAALLNSYAWNAKAIAVDFLAEEARRFEAAGVKLPDNEFGRKLSNPPSKKNEKEMTTQRAIFSKGTCK